MIKILTKIFRDLIIIESNNTKIKVKNNKMFGR